MPTNCIKVRVEPPQPGSGERRRGADSSAVCRRDCRCRAAAQRSRLAPRRQAPCSAYGARLGAPWPAARATADGVTLRRDGYVRSACMARGTPGAAGAPARRASTVERIRSSRPCATPHPASQFAPAPRPHRVAALALRPFLRRPARRRVGPDPRLQPGPELRAGRGVVANLSSSTRTHRTAASALPRSAHQGLLLSRRRRHTRGYACRIPQRSRRRRHGPESRGPDAALSRRPDRPQGRPCRPQVTSW